MAINKTFIINIIDKVFEKIFSVLNIEKHIFSFLSLLVFYSVYINEENLFFISLFMFSIISVCNRGFMSLFLYLKKNFLKDFVKFILILIVFQLPFWGNIANYFESFSLQEIQSFFIFEIPYVKYIFVLFLMIFFYNYLYRIISKMLVLSVISLTMLFLVHYGIIDGNSYNFLIKSIILSYFFIMFPFVLVYSYFMVVLFN